MVLEPIRIIGINCHFSKSHWTELNITVTFVEIGTVSPKIRIAISTYVTVIAKRHRTQLNRTVTFVKKIKK